MKKTRKIRIQKSDYFRKEALGADPNANTPKNKWGIYVLVLKECNFMWEAKESFYGFNGYSATIRSNPFSSILTEY